MNSNEDFIRPDQISKCTWSKNANIKDSPHKFKELKDVPKIYPNILHTIGHSPLVKLNNIPKSFGIKCDMFVKCEFMNPGGSVKDRIGFRMIEEMENKGIIKPGYTLIEPTSGNTGVGIAMASAVKGYKCIIVMPEKMSNEKVSVLRALGAQIIRTPTAAAFDSPEGLFKVAQKLNREIPNSYILDQYRNPGNPLVHYDGTAAEIIDQCEGKLDMIVVGAGTGGTITGIGKYFKEKCPDCQVVAADPEGSLLSLPDELNKTDVTYYEVEGVGYDFIPTVLDRSVVDRWVKTRDKESFLLARRLISEEGLLCGGSSGTALSVALKAAAELKEGQRCVVILPDSIRNYITKFASDSWMIAKNFIDVPDNSNHWWWNLKIQDIPIGCYTTISSTTTCEDAINIMKKENMNQIVIVNENKFIQGVVVNSNLLTKIIEMRLKLTDTVDKITSAFLKMSAEETLSKASRILEKEQFVVVYSKENADEKFSQILTSIDVLNFISNVDNQKKYQI